MEVANAKSLDNELKRICKLLGCTVQYLQNNCNAGDWREFYDSLTAAVSVSNHLQPCKQAFLSLMQ